MDCEKSKLIYYTCTFFSVKTMQIEYGKIVYVVLLLYFVAC